jgi:hypothetical protein
VIERIAQGGRALSDLQVDRPGAFDGEETRWLTHSHDD